LVLPGKYQIKLTADGRTQSAALEVLADPRVKVPAADLEKQFDLSMRIYHSISRMHEAINQIRDLKSQIQSLRKRLEDDPKLKPLVAASEDLEKKLSLVEEKLIQVNMKGSEANLAFPGMLNEQFDSFASSVEGADTAPTQQQYEVYTMLDAGLADQLKKLDSIISADLATFEEASKGYNIPVLFVPKARH
jgi:seryl-tRNA synthetase